jgi:hypothetical protein
MNRDVWMMVLEFDSMLGRWSGNALLRTCVGLRDVAICSMDRTAAGREWMCRWLCAWSSGLLLPSWFPLNSVKASWFSRRTLQMMRTRAAAQGNVVMWNLLKTSRCDEYDQQFAFVAVQHDQCILFQQAAGAVPTSEMCAFAVLRDAWRCVLLLRCLWPTLMDAVEHPPHGALYILEGILAASCRANDPRLLPAVVKAGLRIDVSMYSLLERAPLVCQVLFDLNALGVYAEQLAHVLREDQARHVLTGAGNDGGVMRHVRAAGHPSPTLLAEVTRHDSSAMTSLIASFCVMAAADTPHLLETFATVVGRLEHTHLVRVVTQLVSKTTEDQIMDILRTAGSVLPSDVCAGITSEGLVNRPRLLTWLLRDATPEQLAYAVLGSSSTCSFDPAVENRLRGQTLDGECCVHALLCGCPHRMEWFFRECKWRDPLPALQTILSCVVETGNAEHCEAARRLFPDLRLALPSLRVNHEIPLPVLDWLWTLV